MVEPSRRRPDVVVREIVRRAPGGRIVLDRVTATFAAGQVTVVHGANGSGKSMLARVIAGVDRPDEGSVSTGRTAAFLLPERAAVLPGCSARTLGAALANNVGASGSAWSTRLDNALERLASTHGSRAPLSRLSKGNLQTAYLSVAYALRPPLAVLDEPMTGLDADASAAASGLVRELAADGSVVVVTAHRPGAYGDVNRLLTGGQLAPASAVAPMSYLVDLSPADQARHLLAGADNGSRVVPPDRASRADHLRISVDADHLDLVLRAALASDVKITRVVEDVGW